MENLKAIGVKLDPNTIRLIDEFRSSHYYLKRNTIINALLTTIMNVADKSTIYEMIKFDPYRDNTTRAGITFHAKG